MKSQTNCEFKVIFCKKSCVVDFSLFRFTDELRLKLCIEYVSIQPKIESEMRFKKG